MAAAEAAIARVRALSCWSGPVAPEPLGGGLSNRNFTVRDRGRDYVVRIGADLPEHHVERSRELRVGRAAAARGISPAIVHAEPGAMVLERIEGRTFTADDVADPATRARIVALLRRVHVELPGAIDGPPPFFWVFHVLRSYDRLLRGAGHRLSGLDGWAARAATLERAVGPVDLVFAHNDLLAANLIDDGKRLWLIDWEYGGFGSPLFDLANLATNSGLDLEAERSLLAAYFGRPPDPGLWRAYRAWAAASLLREAMWSMAAEIRSSLPIDYAAYADENLGRFEAAWAAFEGANR